MMPADSSSSSIWSKPSGIRSSLSGGNGDEGKVAPAGAGMAIGCDNDSRRDERTDELG